MLKQGVGADNVNVQQRVRDVDEVAQAHTKVLAGGSGERRKTR